MMNGVRDRVSVEFGGRFSLTQDQLYMTESKEGNCLFQTRSPPNMTSRESQAQGFAHLATSGAPHQSQSRVGWTEQAFDDFNYFLA